MEALKARPGCRDTNNGDSLLSEIDVNIKKKWFWLILILAFLLILTIGVLCWLGYFLYLSQYKITTKYSSETATKTFKTIEREDSSLPKGERKIETEGQNGTLRITYRLTYKGDKLTSKKKIKEVVVKAPVDQIVAVGTFTEAPYPGTPEDVIRAYYAAINDHRWEEAWSYITEKQQTGYSITNPGPPEMAAWTGIERFEHSYGDYVRTVSVTNVSSMPGTYPDLNAYLVSFDADYIKPYEGGSHHLPGVHILVQDSTGKWHINEIGTG